MVDHATGDISFYEDTGTTAKLFWDASAESLGIGTSSLSAKLHIDSGASNNGFILDADTAWNSSMYFWNNGSAKWAIRNVGGGADRFSIYSYALADDAVSIDSSGNVGIGVAPESHYTGYVGIDFGKSGGLFSNTSGTNVTGLSNNAYLNSDASAWVYKETDEASYYTQTGGTHRFSVATSGTAGNAISWSEAVRIDSSGNVKIGTNTNRFSYLTATTANLQIDGGVVFEPGAGNNVELFNYRATDMLFGNSGAEDMRLDASGNLLVGHSSLNGTGGVDIGTSGYVRASRSGDEAAIFNRETNDGTIVSLQKDGTSVGSIGTVNGDLLVGTGDTGLRFHDTDNRIYPINTSGGTKVDAAIDLGDPTARFKDLYLSGGAYLGGTAAANLLDDYEEGTFTPTVYSSDNTTVLTSGVDYNLNDYRYVKVGRHVMMEVRIQDLRATKTDIFCTLPFVSLTSDSGVGITAEGDVIYLASNRLNFRKGTNQYPYGIVNFESS
jgi:hypothetical protein